MSKARDLSQLDIGVNVQAHDSNLTSFVSTFTLPTVDGNTDQVLKTDGDGNIVFGDAGGDFNYATQLKFS